MVRDDGYGRLHMSRRFVPAEGDWTVKDAGEGRQTQVDQGQMYSRDNVVREDLWCG